MLKVFIEGVYESDIGSGQKKYRQFKYDYETARVNPKGLFTHALKRHAPYLIQEDKKNAGVIYSRIQSLVITDIQKLDKPCYLQGKDINELDAWSIQDLACLYDLYEIPLHGKYSIAELREKAIEAYLKHVLKIPMETNQEKEALDFYERNEDGSYSLNLKNQKVCVDIIDELLVVKSSEVKKKSLSDFIKDAGRTIANGILTVTGNEKDTIDDDNAQSDSKDMPSADSLLFP